MQLRERVGSGWAGRDVFRIATALPFFTFLGAPGCLAQEPASAPTSLNLEQLLQVQVYSASGYLQSPQTAPASVSIVTAREIQEYGFRTLADILRSVQGLYIVSDRDYSSLGIRGVERPGDLNTRVLLLLDGHRMNDDVYDQAMLGTEFPLDIDLIDRVEIIRGPVSSLYGSNALLGVINIISKRGRNIRGAEVVALAGSLNTDAVRLTYGQQRGTLDLLATTTLFRSKGYNSLFYSAFDSPATNEGIASHIDHDQVESAFVSATDREITVRTMFGTRNKQIPSAPYGAVFNNPGTRTIDTHTLVDVSDDHASSPRWSLLSRAFYDWYHYHGTYAYASDQDSSQISPELDFGYGQWAGAELKATRADAGRSEIAGLEIRGNFQKRQLTYDLNPYALDLDDRRSSIVVAPYGQYAGPLWKAFSINAGLRYDGYSDTKGSWNPRVAVIFEPVAQTKLRFTYGASFREPNVYERYYSVPPNAPNPSLVPEHVRTMEGLWDQTLPAHLLWSASVFHTGLTNLITQVGDETTALTFENVKGIRSTGVSAELAAKYAKGSSLDLNYTFQESRDQTTGQLLSNSPRSLGKLNVAARLPRTSWTTSANAQYVARMSSVAGALVSPYAVVNATVLSGTLRNHFTVSASAYNLFNRFYADPAPGFYVQSSIPEDGRTLRFKILWQSSGS